MKYRKDFVTNSSSSSYVCDICGCDAKQSKWGIRPKVQPKIAHLKSGKIVFDPLTKELLGSF